ncbi:hypothetical protein GWI33_015496 [Rhynchophorus ferrugineus]|uniref:Uncharacterized protein n=1 Tax=Rhynchophorus ferrugineus TaxID=354439 RepID=A0A834ID45_RHYFE|nr:hypothetical protein GWI33_015496 [Rhynchophorus ferrugineus]
MTGENQFLLNSPAKADVFHPLSCHLAGWSADPPRARPGGESDTARIYCSPSMVSDRFGPDQTVRRKRRERRASAQ